VASRARVLRIIGGNWRGRRLRFPPSPQIRPTPDRVRETLFNWLGARVAGSRCLDLFAGSGALGLEALSRGATHVTFVERDGAAARELSERLAEWGAGITRRRSGEARDAIDGDAGIPGASTSVLGSASVEQTDALRFLARPAPHPFDIVFLDPPFADGILSRAADSLERGAWLATGAWIYVECAAREGLPSLPPAWSLLKAKQAGEVGYHLLARVDPQRIDPEQGSR
jgi:16S rRNA (guanine966-N2)-methyltransferase